LLRAGIESDLVTDIGKSVGEICFISALASTTSYLDENIGQIIANDSGRGFVRAAQ
jgi:hypothetical protein